MLNGILLFLAFYLAILRSASYIAFRVRNGRYIFYGLMGAIAIASFLTKGTPNSLFSIAFVLTFLYYLQNFGGLKLRMGKGNMLEQMFKRFPIATLAIIYGKSPQGVMPHLLRFVPYFVSPFNQVLAVTLARDPYGELQKMISSSGNLSSLFEAAFNARGEEDAAVISDMAITTIRNMIVPRTLLIVAGTGTLILIVGMVTILGIYLYFQLKASGVQVLIF